MSMLDLDSLDFDRGAGTVTVVAQDAITGAVLMVAHADREALELTIATGEMHYLSRTRGRWHKGATSGNVQRVLSLRADCDGDAVLACVIPAGPSCHSGEYSCFGASGPAGALAALDQTIADRAASAAEAAPGAAKASYTARLLGDRNLRLKKLGEEAAEFAVACADQDPDGAVMEAADLFYHTLVALRAVGRSLADVGAELARRAAGSPASAGQPPLPLQP